MRPTGSIRPIVGQDPLVGAGLPNPRARPFLGPLRLIGPCWQDHDPSAAHPRPWIPRPLPFSLSRPLVFRLVPLFRGELLGRTRSLPPRTQVILALPADKLPLPIGFPSRCQPKPTSWKAERRKRSKEQLQ